jgi:hypothetical protein
MKVTVNSSRRPSWFCASAGGLMMLPLVTGLPSDVQPDQSASALSCRLCHTVWFRAVTAISRPPPTLGAIAIPFS